MSRSVDQKHSLLVFACVLLCGEVSLGQRFDLLPDIQPATFQVHATTLTDALPVEQERVTEVFTQRVGPIDLVSVPGRGNDILVATYGGVVFRMNPTTGNLQEARFLDLVSPSSPTYSPNFEVGGAHGFSSITFHPDFATANSPGSGKFYTLEAESLESGTPDFIDSTQSGRHHDDVLYEYTMQMTSSSVCTEACQASKREVLRVQQPGWHHNLGDLAFDEQGLLYVSSADGSTSRRTAPFMSDNAQVPTTVFGNILRIDPLGNNSRNGSYGIPQSNPFVGNADFLDEIWAWGFRNPYRIAFDSQTGELYTTDTGELRIESAYRVMKGGNHGWNLKEGSFVYDKTTASVMPDVDEDGSGMGDVAEANELVEPIFEYDRDFGRAIIGTVLYRGDAIPQLNGSLVFGDFDGRLYFGDFQSDDEFEFQLSADSDPLPFQMHSVNEDANGNLYILGIQRDQDDYRGVVVRIDGIHGDCNGDGIVDALDLACSCQSSLLQATLLGDFNGDGAVVFDDFLMLSRNFGLPVASYRDGDANCDGHVDFGDFLILSANFGKSATVASVPEAAWGHGLLSLLASLALAARDRSRPHHSECGGTERS